MNNGMSLQVFYRPNFQNKFYLYDIQMYMYKQNMRTISASNIPEIQT